MDGLGKLSEILGDDDEKFDKDVAETLEFVHKRVSKGSQNGVVLFDMQDVIMGCLTELNAQIAELSDGEEEEET